MSVNIGNETSKLTIYKDEQGRYKTYIPIKEKDENGEYKFVTSMSKKVQFNSDVEVKNQTEIEVVRGWLQAYRIDTGEVNKKGKKIYKYLDKYHISEFKILEEGTDEVQKTRQPKQELQDSFAFDMEQEDLPF